MSAIHQLPPGYREVKHHVLTAPRPYLALNIAALLPLTVSIGLFAGWWMLVLRLRGSRPGGFGADWPWWLWIIPLFIVTVVLHEWLHGLAIRWAGHRPRYGMMLSKGAFYATADNAIFTRAEYLVIALAPILGLTLLALALMWLLPNVAGYYVALMGVFNAASSIGDLWMTAVILRYPPTALIRDEMDSLRVYLRE